MVRSSVRVQPKSKIKGEQSPLTPNTKSSRKESDLIPELNADEHMVDPYDSKYSQLKPADSHENKPTVNSPSVVDSSTRLKLYSAEHFIEGQELIIPPIEMSESMNKDDESATSYPGSESMKQDDTKSDSLTGGNNRDDLTQYSAASQYSLQTGSALKRKCLYLGQGSRCSANE